MIYAAANTAWQFVTGNLWRTGCIALALALGWQTLQLSVARDQRDNARDALAVEKAAHAITRASVDKLTQAVEDQNADIIARSQAYYEARTKAAQNVQTDKAAWQATQARIDALRRSVGQIRPDDCKTPDVGLK